MVFREFCPLYSLLNAIPTKIQKGFRSLLVYLTALDTNGDYIAVGSSIGMLYLYCRHLNQMRKYNFEVSLAGLTPPWAGAVLSHLPLQCLRESVASCFPE